MDIAKKENYEFFEELGLYIGEATLIPWKCIVKLSRDYRDNNDKLYSEIRAVRPYDPLFRLRFLGKPLLGHAASPLGGRNMSSFC